MLNWIELNAANLRHNYQVFAKIVGSEAVAPVLKSNAYGHGLSEIYSILKSEKPSWLAVNYVDEGALLRSLGFEGKILVVGPFIPAELPKAHQNKLEMMVGHIEGVEEWLASQHKPILHVEFDTGMSRQGFHSQDAGDIAEKLLPHKALVKGVCMHFANVEDVTEHEYANLQLERFESARQEFLKRGFSFLSHSASSASTLILDASRFDLTRVGISTYGFWPSQATRISYKQLHGSLVELKPVLSWKTKISSTTQSLKANILAMVVRLKLDTTCKWRCCPSVILRVIRGWLREVRLMC